MESNPDRATLDALPAINSDAEDRTTAPPWPDRLPVLQGAPVILRQLQMSDAASLLAMLTTEEVSRFISPPPTTLEGFERFIAWTLQQQAAGRYACFGVVHPGAEAAMGIFQVKQLDRTFETAEWGFASGAGFWGTSVFVESVRRVLGFAFETTGVPRLEARPPVSTGGGLRKMGAVPEGVLRRSFLRDGRFFDQAMWAIIRADWYETKGVWGTRH